MLTINLINDIILDDEQRTDFFMPINWAFSRRPRNLTVFCSSAERSPFLLEDDMPSGIPKNGINTGRFIMGHKRTKTVDKIIKICSICKAKFLVYPSQDHRVACSFKCGHISQSKKTSKKNNTRWIHRVDRICKFCGKNFKAEQWEVKNGFGEFCSRQCMFDSRKIRTNTKCPNCKKIFSIKKSKLKLNKKYIFCSLKCYKEYIDGSVILICKNCGKEYKAYKSHIEHRGSSYCSRKCHQEHNVGENNPMWKGGIKFWKIRDTSSYQHRQWREAVFTRDNWTCQKCGARSKAKLSIIIHPHHIKHYAKYPKLRYKIDNGKTLCIDCHKELHKEERRKQKEQNENV